MVLIERNALSPPCFCIHLSFDTCSSISCVISAVEGDLYSTDAPAPTTRRALFTLCHLLEKHRAGRLRNFSENYGEYKPADRNYKGLACTSRSTNFLALLQVWGDCCPVANDGFVPHTRRTLIDFAAASMIGSFQEVANGFLLSPDWRLWAKDFNRGPQPSRR